MKHLAIAFLAGLFVTACSFGGAGSSPDSVRAQPLRVKQLPPADGMWHNPKIAPELHALIGERACDVAAYLGQWRAPIDPADSKILQAHLSKSMAVEAIHSQAWRVDDDLFDDGEEFSGEVWCLTVPDFDARYALIASTRKLAQSRGDEIDRSFAIGPGQRDNSGHPNVHKMHGFEFNSVGIPTGGEYRDVVEDRACHLQLSFGSYGSGTAQVHAVAMVDRLLERDEVTKIYAQAWGREGEQDYCAAIPDLDAREAVLADLTLISETLGEPKGSPMAFGLLPEQDPDFVPYREPELVRYPGGRYSISDREMFSQWYTLLETGGCHVMAVRGGLRDRPRENRKGLQMGRREGVARMYFQPWGKESEASFCYEIPDEAKRQVIFDKIRNDPEVEGYFIVEDMGQK